MVWILIGSSVARNIEIGLECAPKAVIFNRLRHSTGRRAISSLLHVLAVS
jgi:hypothetical protein